MKVNMQNARLISIIVPVYNGEPFLEECLESIKKQTYSNLEIILVYTECADNSLKICQKYCKEDERFKLFYNETNLKGPGISRNIGLDQVKGDFIGFVDADDVIAADMYDILLKNIVEYNSEISICKESRKQEEIYQDTEGKISIFENSDILREFLIGSNFYGELWNKLFERTLIKELRFIETGVGQDVMFVWSALKNTKRVVFCNKKKYFYRFNPQGITKRFNEDNIQRTFDIYNIIGKDIQKDYMHLYPYYSNRMAIITAQSYYSYRMGKLNNPKLKKKIAERRKQYIFDNSCKGYQIKEKILVKIYRFQPQLAFFAYKIYFKLCH